MESLNTNIKMKIKSKLYLGALISIIVVVIVGSITFITSHELAEKSREQALAYQMHVAISELDILTYEYLLYREKRVEQQWSIKYHEAAASVGEELALSIRADYGIFGDLFSEVTTNHEKRLRFIQEGVSQEKINAAATLEERLVAQLLTKSQSIIADTSSLAEKANAELVESQELARNLTLALILVLAIVVTTTSLLVARSISKPLERLTEYTKRIGNGEFMAEVEIAGKDEVSSVASDVKTMVGQLLLTQENLKATTVSRDELAQEVTERKQAEHYARERVKELTCLYEISRLVSETKTSLAEILKETVELIPNSWQYPEITRARVTFGGKEFKKDNFEVTEWKQSSDIRVGEEKLGTLEVYYLEEKPEIDEGPFSKEERLLIDSLAERLGQIVASKRAEEELEKYRRHLEELVKEQTRDLKARTTELEEANIHLQEVDRLKSVFLASMSHELRTPLNSIIGFTGIILQGMAGEVNEEQSKQLTMTRNSASHLLSLINDVLDISKIEAGRVELSPEEFSLDDLVREAVETLSPTASAKGLELTMEIPEGITLFSDKRCTKQILMNLLSNAVKFTDQGSVKIAARFIRDDNLEVRVTDTGVGIKKEDMGNLFQPFQQVDVSLTKKNEGTGLGLYLTKKLATILRGDISVKCRYGKGSEFTFTVPLKYEEEPRSEANTGS